MVQLGKRCPDVSVARLSHAQAKIHVIESDRQILLIQTADRFKNGLFNHQTSSGDCRQILRQSRTPLVTQLIATNTHVDVPSHAPQTEHDTTMLQRVVREP